jgi:hypothetical protein
MQRGDGYRQAQKRSDRDRCAPNAGASPASGRYLAGIKNNLQSLHFYRAFIFLAYSNMAHFRTESRA